MVHLIYLVFDCERSKIKVKTQFFCTEMWSLLLY